MQLTDELMRQISEGQGDEPSIEDWDIIMEGIEKLQMTVNEWYNIFPTWPVLPPGGNPLVFIEYKLRAGHFRSVAHRVLAWHCKA